MVPKSTELDNIKGQIKPKADWRAIDSPKKPQILTSLLLETFQNSGWSSCVQTSFVEGDSKIVSSCYQHFFEYLLKVRQSRNDFFKPIILPKNERRNFTTMIPQVDLFLFGF